MTNQGMVADYRLARKRREFGYTIGSSGAGSIVLNFAFLWPFESWSAWLAQGLVAAFTVSFFISAVDYGKKADEIEKAWEQAYGRPG